ncbi:unnamed protein product [Boreogadus saida]
MVSSQVGLSSCIMGMARVLYGLGLGAHIGDPTQPSKGAHSQHTPKLAFIRQLTSRLTVRQKGFYAPYAAFPLQGDKGGQIERIASQPFIARSSNSLAISSHYRGVVLPHSLPGFHTDPAGLASTLTSLCSFQANEHFNFTTLVYCGKTDMLPCHLSSRWVHSPQQSLVQLVLLRVDWGPQLLLQLLLLQLLLLQLLLQLCSTKF